MTIIDQFAELLPRLTDAEFAELSRTFDRIGDTTIDQALLAQELTGQVKLLQEAHCADEP